MRPWKPKACDIEDSVSPYLVRRATITRRFARIRHMNRSPVRQRTDAREREAQARLDSRYPANLIPHKPGEILPLNPAYRFVSP
jgi:hypothetical protein